jgi:multidrug efflux pump subunit AcrA (membrane-fusion protein)
VKRPVRLGASSEGRVEILEGLKEGEPVVVAGVFVLKSEGNKDELKGHED